MKSKSTSEIIIPKPDLRELKVTIIGESPLLFHKWSEKAKKQIRDKQMKKAKVKRPERDPQKEYEDSFYYNSKKEIAFPALCIKQAMVGACRSLSDIPMTLVRGAVFVMGDEDGLIKVNYKKKEMREDMVRVMRGGADLRYRGMLKKWSMTFKVKFNAGVFSPEMVLNLLQTAGFSQGIGEWRPEKNGDFGTFKINE